MMAAMARDPRAHPLLGLAFVVAAAVPYLAASNVLPADDSDFGVPRWALAWIVVVCFFTPGLLVLGSVLPEEGYDTARRAGPFPLVLAAVLPTLLALHAGQHAFARTGMVRVAWLGLSAFAAFLAVVNARRLARRRS